MGWALSGPFLGDKSRRVALGSWDFQGQERDTRAHIRHRLNFVAAWGNGGANRSHQSEACGGGLYREHACLKIRNASLIRLQVQHQSGSNLVLLV